MPNENDKPDCGQIVQLRPLSWDRKSTDAAIQYVLANGVHTRIIGSRPTQMKILRSAVLGHTHADIGPYALVQVDYIDVNPVTARPVEHSGIFLVNTRTSLVIKGQSALGSNHRFSSALNPKNLEYLEKFALQSTQDAHQKRGISEPFLRQLYAFDMGANTNDAIFYLEVGEDSEERTPVWQKRKALGYFTSGKLSFAVESSSHHIEPFGNYYQIPQAPAESPNKGRKINPSQDRSLQLMDTVRKEFGFLQSVEKIDPDYAIDEILLSKPITIQDMHYTVAKVNAHSKELQREFQYLLRVDERTGSLEILPSALFLPYVEHEGRVFGGPDRFLKNAFAQLAAKAGLESDWGDQVQSTVTHIVYADGPLKGTDYIYHSNYLVIAEVAVTAKGVDLARPRRKTLFLRMNGEKIIEPYKGLVEF